MEPIAPPSAVLTVAAWMNGDQIVARVRMATPGEEAVGIPDAVALVGQEAILDAVRGWLVTVQRRG